jgi:hypothetical protein
MDFKKQYSKTKLICTVTFSIQKKTASEVAVVGDSNNWSTKD